MQIKEILEQNKPSFSFEFFPPKTPKGAEALFETISELEQLAPAFVSVTYGAGGSTRDLTHDLVVRIKSTTSLEAVPHLTCVCHSKSDIEDILSRYSTAEVSNILALGGDPPRDMQGYNRNSDAFQHASELVTFIKRFGASGRHPSPSGFGIGVAGFPEGHPATPNRLVEMDYLKAKVDAGADYICTQLFFDNRDFLDFRERCELAGISVPILAGIMPVSTVVGMQRMADFAAGVRFPAALQRRVRACADDADVTRVGVEWATEQCQELVDNQVRGIHFYTLNKSRATLDILDNLSR